MLSKSTAAKCAPMEVVKLPEYGKQLRNKNDPPFRQTMLIANKSKNFANESESKKCSEIYLI